MIQYEQVTELVIKVTDGDTFETTNRIVRLDGVDTPEKGQLGFEEATNYLIELVEDKCVEISIRARDEFGRYVAQVRVKGQSVNDLMKKLTTS